MPYLHSLISVSDKMLLKFKVTQSKYMCRSAIGDAVLTLITVRVMRVYRQQVSHYQLFKYPVAITPVFIYYLQFVR